MLATTTEASGTMLVQKKKKTEIDLMGERNRGGTLPETKDRCARVCRS